MQGSAVALRVCVKDVSTPVAREYSIAIQAKPPSTWVEPEDDDDDEKERWKETKSKTERAASNKEPQFVNNALVFGMPWLTAEDVAAEELCCLRVQLVAKPSMEDPPGLMYDNRERDHLVADVSFEVAGAMAAQLLAGDTLGLSLDLEDVVQGSGLDDAQLPGMQLSSRSVMRKALPAAGPKQVALTLQVVATGAALASSYRPRLRKPVEEPPPQLRPPKLKIKKQKPAKPSAAPRPLKPPKPAKKAKARAGSGAASWRQQPQQDEPAGDSGDVKLQVLVSHAADIYRYGKKHFWTVGYKPAYLLIELELTQDQQVICTGATTAAVEYECIVAKVPINTVVWDQLLELPLPPGQRLADLPRCSLTMHLTCVEENGRKVVPPDRHLQCTVPLNNVLPGQHVNLEVEMEKDPNERVRTKDKVAHKPVLRVTLCAAGAAGPLRPALPPAGRWLQLLAQLPLPSRPLATAMGEAQTAPKAKNVQTPICNEVWAAWRLQPAGETLPSLTMEQLVECSSVHMPKEYEAAAAVMEQLEQGAIDTGSGQVVASCGVLDLVPVQRWLEGQAGGGGGGGGQLWEDEHLSAVLLAEQRPGSQLLLELQQLVRRRGLVVGSQLLGSVALDVGQLVSGAPGQWQVQQGRQVELSEAASAGGPATVDLAFKAIRLTSEPQSPRPPSPAEPESEEEPQEQADEPEPEPEPESESEEEEEVQQDVLPPSPRPPRTITDMEFEVVQRGGATAGEAGDAMGLPPASAVAMLLADAATKQALLESELLQGDDLQLRLTMLRMRHDEQRQHCVFLEGEVAQLQHLLHLERAAARDLPPAPGQLAGLGPKAVLQAYRQLLELYTREQRKAADVLRHLAAAHSQRAQLGELQVQYQALQEAHMVLTRKLSDITEQIEEVANHVVVDRKPEEVVQQQQQQQQQPRQPSTAHVSGEPTAGSAAKWLTILKPNAKRQKEVDVVKQQVQVIAKLERALAAAADKGKDVPEMEAELRQLREENAFLQQLRHKKELDLMQQRQAALQQQVAAREEEWRQREMLLREQAAQRDAERSQRERLLLEQLAARDAERHDREHKLAEQAKRHDQEMELREQELRAQLAARESVLREQLSKLERDKIAALLRGDQESARAASAHNELMEATKRFAHEIAQMKARISDKDSLLLANGIDGAELGSVLDAPGGRLLVPAGGVRLQMTSGKLFLPVSQSNTIGRLRPLDSRSSSVLGWPDDARRGGSANGRMEGTRAYPLAPVSQRTTKSDDGPSSEVGDGPGPTIEELSRWSAINMMTHDEAVRRRSIPAMAEEAVVQGFTDGTVPVGPDSRQGSPGSLI